MSDSRLILSAMVQALISGTFGCLDAAALTLDARWGRGASKGTLSRKIAGSLDVTVCDVIALEDAAGRYPITHWLALRLADAVPEARDMRALAAGIAKESGEAVAAILAAELSDRAGDRAQALVEMDEAIAAMMSARSRLVTLQ